MTDIEILTELVQVTRTGAVFFEEARLAAMDPDLRSLYARIAAHKRRTTAALGAHLPGGSTAVAFDGILVNALRSMYADMMAKLGRIDQRSHSEQLASVESRLLEHYDHATAHLHDDHARHSLRSLIRPSALLLAEMRALRMRKPAQTGVAGLVRSAA